MMTDESVRRLNRLAERAKQLDDMIQKAAQMQKKIVESIQKLGASDKVKRQRMTSARKPRKRTAARRS
jgi:small-conductance mechanosensitive channel